MDKNKTLEILKRAEILPEKRFGQNFLCDDDITDMIIEASGIGIDSKVLEIGPGIGALTRKASDIGASVTAVEIDKRLASFLKEELPSVNIISSDFLKTRREDLGCFDHIISNLPYYVMTPIMNKLLTSYPDAAKMTFMVEEEAVSRIAAKPGTKQYGPLSILCSLYGDIKRVTNVPRESFYPQPNTLSTVLTLTRRDETADVLSNEFLRFLEVCFSQRRKKITNNLQAYKSREEIAKILMDNGFDGNIRAEDLRPYEFATLFGQMI